MSFQYRRHRSVNLRNHDTAIFSSFFRFHFMLSTTRKDSYMIGNTPPPVSVLAKPVNAFQPSPVDFPLLPGYLPPHKPPHSQCLPANEQMSVKAGSYPILVTATAAPTRSSTHPKQSKLKVNAHPRRKEKTPLSPILCPLPHRENTQCLLFTKTPNVVVCADTEA